jgi:hypothetical protein
MKDVIEVDESTGSAVVVSSNGGQLSKMEAKKARLARLADVEDELLDEASTVLMDAHRFAEIGPGDEAPPQSWVDELGEAGAAKRFRVAQAAWMKGTDAPVGLKLASATVSAIIKAKAQRDGKEVPVFNVAVVMLPGDAPPQFPELEVEK